MLFHAPQRLGKQFLLPVEKGFGSRGRGAYRLPYNIGMPLVPMLYYRDDLLYRLPYNIGMPHVILHRYNDQTDFHYIQNKLNHRPRKKLGFRTPFECFFLNFP